MDRFIRSTLAGATTEKKTKTLHNIDDREQVRIAMSAWPSRKIAHQFLSFFFFSFPRFGIQPYFDTSTSRPFPHSRIRARKLRFYCGRLTQTAVNQVRRLTPSRLSRFVSAIWPGFSLFFPCPRMATVSVRIRWTAWYLPATARSARIRKTSRRTPRVRPCSARWNRVNARNVANPVAKNGS